MRVLVYTVVFGGYDRVFPPVVPFENSQCIIITDDPHLRVRGWQTRFVDPGPFGSARAANRHFKMIGHRDLGQFDASIYVDGNIRLLKDPVDLATQILESGSALGVFPHPRRSSVAEEIEACANCGKLPKPEKAWAELATYTEDGFPDNSGLIEATILVKNHGHAKLDEAMLFWHTLYATHQTRDQISLPYVLWKTQLPCYLHPWSFREPNDHFGVYPHAGAKSVPSLYTYQYARSYDSRLHGIGILLWHGKWVVQRLLRRLRRKLL